MTEAVLVIDMINDFVYGKLGSEGARGIVDVLEDFLANTESYGIPIVFCQDSHSKSDPEMDVFGEHAMKGEEGAQTIPELSIYQGINIPKSFYDSFHLTDLHPILRELSVDTVILTGVVTDICIQHTAAGAFFRGFDIIVVNDCTAAVEESKHKSSLEYMENVYGAKLMSSEEIIKKWKKGKGVKGL